MVDSDLRCGRVGLLTNNSVEANHACCSRSICGACRYPHRSWRDLRFLGTQLIDLVDYFAVAGQWGEDVETCGPRRRYHRIAGTLCPASGQGTGAHRQHFTLVVIQEAGLDGLWIHRILETEGIESHVVDAASIGTLRRRRRAKTDEIDGEALVRALLAYKRGEPRVCAMVRVPSVKEEDHRRIGLERKALVGERTCHVNRIKGLLFAQGITGYEPLDRARRHRLEELRTGDGRALPEHPKGQIHRELDRLGLLIAQIKEVQAERDVKSPKLQQRHCSISRASAPTVQPSSTRKVYSGTSIIAGRSPLSRARADTLAERIGPARARRLEGGNPRLRTTMIELAWLWLRNQPGSSLPAGSTNA